MNKSIKPRKTPSVSDQGLIGYVGGNSGHPNAPISKAPDEGVTPSVPSMDLSLQWIPCPFNGSLSLQWIPGSAPWCITNQTKPLTLLLLLPLQYVIDGIMLSMTYCYRWPGKSSFRMNLETGGTASTLLSKKVSTFPSHCFPRLDDTEDASFLRS
jgi:hypothetical protein